MNVYCVPGDRDILSPEGAEADKSASLDGQEILISPENISGMYLVCNHTPAKQEGITNDITVGCAISSDRSEAQKIDLQTTGMGHTWNISYDQNQVVSTRLATTPDDTWHVNYQFKALAGQEHQLFSAIMNSSIRLTWINKSGIKVSTQNTIGNSLTWQSTANNRIQYFISNPASTDHTSVPVKINVPAEAGDQFVLKNHAGEDVPFQTEQTDINGNRNIWVFPDRIPEKTGLYLNLYFGQQVITLSSPTSWAQYEGVWHFDQTPDNWGDSARKHQTTLIGDPSTTPGPVGTAMDISGGSKAIEVGSLENIIGRSFTLSFWFKTNQSGTSSVFDAPGITGIEDFRGRDDIFVGWLDENGLIGIRGGDDAAIKSSVPVNDNSWVHITFTREEDSGNINLYLNGELSGSGTSKDGFLSTPFSQFGMIDNNNAEGIYFDGQIDEIRMKSFVDSREKVEAEYKYQLDDASSSTKIYQRQ